MEHNEHDNYDGHMDKECIEICDFLNALRGIKTYESCCGHYKDHFRVWFRCRNFNLLSLIARSADRRYSRVPWNLMVQTVETPMEPFEMVGFCLECSKIFKTEIEMQRAVEEFTDNIDYWWQTMGVTPFF